MTGGPPEAPVRLDGCRSTVSIDILRTVLVAVPHIHLGVLGPTKSVRLHQGEGMGWLGSHLRSLAAVASSYTRQIQMLPCRKGSMVGFQTPQTAVLHGSGWRSEADRPQPP